MCDQNHVHCIVSLFVIALLSSEECYKTKCTHKKTQTNMHLIMNAISKFVTSYFWSHNVQNSHGRYKAFMNMFTSMTVILQWYDAFCDFCEEL